MTFPPTGRPEQHTYGARGLTPTQKSREARRVVFASFIGTAIEWYDFFLYGVTAALVFGPQFFPSSNELASQLAALSTFTVGFVIRPLAGAVAGHLGDRIGRKRMLVASLLLMGCATVGIGLLPGYAHIGILAPVLLVVLRLAQGAGVGAEWGGAALMAVEHAPPHRRGLYGSAPQVGVPAGAITANLVLLLASQLTGDAFASWGWRIPFLASAVLVVVGLVVRGRINESPLFERAATTRRPTRAPVLEVVRRHPLALLRGALVTVAAPAFGYIVLTYVLSYGTAQVGYTRNTLLAIVIAASFWQVVALLGFSGLTDRLGRKRVMLAGAAAQIAAALIFFPLFDTGRPLLALLACCVAITTISAQYGPLGALLAELFPTRVRYSGASVGYQLGNILGGGLAPLVATALFAASGASWTVGLYLAGASAVTLVAIALTRDTTSVDLAHERH